MSIQTIPHEETENVTVWDLSDWSGNPKEIAGAEEEWLEVANRPGIDASVLVFGEDTNLGPETQEHVGDQWSTLTDQADIEKAAYVSPGLTALAVTANVESTSAAVESFSDLDEAMEWAKD